MINNRKAFTMIELVFVIVVLGILASVAIPRFAATRDDAQIAKGRSDISSIRAGIITERQGRLFRGNSSFITNAAMDSAAGLFDGVMAYPITAGAVGEKGRWRAVVAGTTYTFIINAGTATFTYNQANGVFDCVTNNPNAACTALTAN